MASASASPHSTHVNSRAHHALAATSSAAAPTASYTRRGHPNERVSPSRSVALTPGTTNMGAKSSRPVARGSNPSTSRPPLTENNPVPTIASGRRGSMTTPLTTAYSRKNSMNSPADQTSICRSPTWSPRGSLAARNEADRDRRDRERALRKEAEEAKKRLKEFKEQGRKKSDPAPPVVAEDLQSTKKLQKKRWSRRPPPAAMETQRLPAALRTSMERSSSDQSATHDDEQQKRRSRSSSLSSMLRLVTGRSRSRSASRPNSMTDDEMYMSDVSTKSRASFIGGVKLNQQRKRARESQTSADNKSPNIQSTGIKNDRSFSHDIQAQFDKITGRPNRDMSGRTALANITNTDKARSRSRPSEAADEEVNANMGRRRSQKIDADSKPRPEARPPTAKAHGISPEEIKKRRSSIGQRLESSQEASMSRLQNLVTPLRSAMKGSRETAKDAKGARTQSMPMIATQTYTSSTKQPLDVPEGGNYVQRSRLNTQTRSLAGWNDEMAVKEANELAAAPVDSTSTGKPDLGTEMPPAPQGVVREAATPRNPDDNVVRSHENARPAEPALPIAGPSSKPISVADASEHIPWKQPIKANKAAAAGRLEQHGELPLRAPTDIDMLPFQKRSVSKPGSPVSSPITQLMQDISGDMQNMPSPTSPISSDEESRRLRRQPAVMSWKAEKDASKTKLRDTPRSPTIPEIPVGLGVVENKPIERTLRPEDHPSLAALRSGGSPKPQDQSEFVDAYSIQPDYTDPIERPFSIVPTPVPSPAPGIKAKPSSKSIKTTKEPPKSAAATTKEAAYKALETLRQRQSSEHGHNPPAVTEDEKMRIASPLPTCRHSTPPVELTLDKRPANKLETKPTFPFPDRHEPLVKPTNASNTNISASSRSNSRPPPTTRVSSSKVTFHTPPESPRFLSVSTSYDSYRRPYSTNDASVAQHSPPPDDDDDEMQLPVPISELGKPNPPFAREGLGKRVKTPSPARAAKDVVVGTNADASSRSRAVSAERGNGQGYVYVNFSPAGSSSTVNLNEASGRGKRIPKGFVIKNAEGQALDPVAKLFVVCCGCNKWHDVPSGIYREMARGLREIEDKKDERETGKRVSSAKGKVEEETPKEQGKNVKRRRSAVISTVPCCWCKHEMSVMCCEGWSSLCYMSAQYHTGATGGSGGVIGNERNTPKVKAVAE